LANTKGEMRGVLPLDIETVGVGMPPGVVPCREQRKNASKSNGEPWNARMKWIVMIRGVLLPHKKTPRGATTAFVHLGE
jgi:hypothetical protein